MCFYNQNLIICGEYDGYLELVSLTQLEVVHTARLNGAEGIYNLIRLESQLEIGWCTDVGFGITKVRY